MPVIHALSCKKGHENTVDEGGYMFVGMCRQHTSFGRVNVKHEPRITSSTHQRESVTPDTNATVTNITLNLHLNWSNDAVNVQLSNAGCHGFWQIGRPCIFDFRITDTN